MTFNSSMYETIAQLPYRSNQTRSVSRRWFGLSAFGGVLSAIATTAGATTLLESVAGAQTKSGMGQEMQDCVARCNACHDSCIAAIDHCAQKGGKASADRIRLLLDCAASCQQSVDFMLRESSFHPKMCGICAEICITCAKNCDGVGDDSQLKACAAACRTCADSCRRMSAG